LAQGLAQLLQDPQRRVALGRIGERRMGPAGGSEALARLLERRLLQSAAGPGGMMA